MMSNMTPVSKNLLDSDGGQEGEQKIHIDEKSSALLYKLLFCDFNLKWNSRAEVSGRL